MKYLLFSILLFIFLNQQENPNYAKYDKIQIIEILKGEWEREAVGYEKNACKESDRFIMSFIMGDSNFNADGHLEYFTYLSNDEEAKICYLDHGSSSFVFFDIILKDSITILDVTGYLWSEKWSLNIIDSNKIVLDNKKYTRNKLIKTDKWYEKEK